MDTSRISDYIQTAASIGVIFSLVFVGLEIQQSRDIAIADIHQQRSAMSIQALQGTYSVERYGEVIGRFLAGEEISDKDKGLLGHVQNVWFAYWENIYVQYQMGLLDELSWESSRRTISNRFRWSLYQEWWESNRGYWHEDFAREVDNILIEVRAGQ